MFVGAACHSDAPPLLSQSLSTRTIRSELISWVKARRVRRQNMLVSASTSNAVATSTFRKWLYAVRADTHSSLYLSPLIRLKFVYVTSCNFIFLSMCSSRLGLEDALAYNMMSLNRFPGKGHAHLLWRCSHETRAVTGQQRHFIASHVAAD